MAIIHVQLLIGLDHLATPLYSMSLVYNIIVRVLAFSLVPPVVQPFSFGEVAMNSGQVITAPCSVIEGDHPLQLTWLFNDEPVKPRSGITVFQIGERSAILSIGSVTHAHAGNYTCVAKNDAGTNFHTSTLNINGAYILNIFISVFFTHHQCNFLKYFMFS